MNMSAHWVDNELTAYHKCLSVKRVLRSDSVEMITSQLNNVINEWSLDVNSLCVVVSGGDRVKQAVSQVVNCLLYTSPSPRDGLLSRMPSSA